ncbi:MAG: hypothetical protein IH841_08300 [Thaumarchaeota archaeon]|nr:hypothetical protein [Nitrososphaerota archaeon]
MSEFHGHWQILFSDFVTVPILLSIFMSDDVYASSYTVRVPSGTSVPGCEQTNECWLPAKISVGVGDTVIWSNDDTAAHTVTSGIGAYGPDGNFDSSLFVAGRINCSCSNITH